MAQVNRLTPRAHVSTYLDTGSRREGKRQRKLFAITLTYYVLEGWPAWGHSEPRRERGWGIKLSMRVCCAELTYTSSLKNQQGRTHPERCPVHTGMPYAADLLAACLPRLGNEALAGIQLATYLLSVGGKVEEVVSVDSIRVRKFLVCRGCITSAGGFGRGWYDTTVRLHALNSSKLAAQISKLALIVI